MDLKNENSVGSSLHIFGNHSLVKPEIAPYLFSYRPISVVQTHAFHIPILRPFSFTSRNLCAGQPTICPIKRAIIYYINSHPIVHGGFFSVISLELSARGQVSGKILNQKPSDFHKPQILKKTLPKNLYARSDGKRCRSCCPVVLVDLGPNSHEKHCKSKWHLNTILNTIFNEFFFLVNRAPWVA